MGARKGENQHGGNVVQGHGSDYHKRRHACVSVDILDKSDAKNGGTSPKGCLHKLPCMCFIFVEKGCQKPDNGNTEKGHKKAIQDIAGIPDRIKIGVRNIPKEQYRQCDFKVKRVQSVDKGFVYNLKLPQNIAEHHQQKDGYGCVKAEYEVFHNISTSFIYAA